MSVTKDLMVNYQHVIEEIQLVMGDKGIFDVEVDGKMLYSKAKTNCKPEDGEVLELFTSLVGKDVPRYGT